MAATGLGGKVLIDDDIPEFWMMMRPCWLDSVG